MATSDTWWESYQDALAALRAAGDIEAAQRLVMTQWWRIVGELDRIDRRWMCVARSLPGPGHPLSAQRLAERAPVRDEMRLVLARVAEWPAAAMGLLDHRDLKAWRPFLIGRLAAHPEHRTEMIDRAFVFRRGRAEIADAFIRLARAEGDRALLDLGERLLKADPVGDALVLRRLVDAFNEFGDVGKALTWAVQGLAGDDPQPLVDLLGTYEFPAMSQPVVDALNGNILDSHCVMLIGALREAGQEGIAAALAGCLTDPADIMRCAFDHTARLVGSDPVAALNVAESVVNQLLDGGTLPPGLDDELAGLLRTVALSDSMAERVLDLAGLIAARPLREEIAANVACHLVIAGNGDRARRLLSSMTSEAQRQRILTALGDVSG